MKAAKGRIPAAMKAALGGILMVMKTAMGEIMAVVKAVMGIITTIVLQKTMSKMRVPVKDTAPATTTAAGREIMKIPTPATL